MKKIITTLLLTICSCALIFTGCGSNNKSTDTKTETTAKTYNYSDMYKTAKTQLENSILDDETYSALSETLKFYEKKDLTSLSKKDAKKIKSTCTEISEYYEASAQSIQDTLSQLGSVYPTDESFYDDNFKTNTSTMFIDLNSLMTEGKYKEAAVKLNEITSAYTAYVESKGEVVTADVSVTAEKTTKTKDQIVAKKAVSNNNGNSGSTKSSSNATSNTTNTASNNTSVNTGSNSNNTNNTTGNTSSNTNTSKPGSTSSNTNKSNTTTNNSSNKNNNTSSSNSNQNTFEAKTYLFGPDVDGSGTNQAYCTSQAEYNAAYKIYMQHVNAYGEEQKRQQEEQKRQQEEADAEAAAFAYVSGCNEAMIAWEAQYGYISDQRAWCNEHGYDYDLMIQYCNKYGW